MTDNEKAAIAAGLWDQAQFQCMYDRPCDDPSHTGYRPRPVPDMHDPANLWRALESLEARGDFISCQSDDGGWLKAVGGEPVRSAWWWLQTKTVAVQPKEWNVGLRDALFAALVALYDAEHPTEGRNCQS